MIGRLGVILATAALLGGAATAAQAAPSDPLFEFTPPTASGAQNPPPGGYFEGPCGLGVDGSGRLYVSDYYHHAIHVFTPTGLPPLAFENQLNDVDPLDGPCGVAFDSASRLYVNDYHRNVTRYGASPSFGVGTVLPQPPEADPALHLPTGVAVNPSSATTVYVNDRTYVTAYEASSGAPLMDGAEPLKIGLGNLGDGYGLAVSGFPATAGRIYVPDASDDTVKVYDPGVSKTNPVASISGPPGGFASLRDSAIAVDRTSGKVYVADNRSSPLTEQPQATIQVFSSAGAYLGHLKYAIVDALPPGLTVDNSATGTQGRVYVTSGNTAPATILGYGPNAETTAAVLPTGSSPPPGSPGAGGAAASAGPGQCTASCGERPASAAEARSSEIKQVGNLQVALSGSLAPKKLPRQGSAPIAVTVGWKIQTTDGSAPPTLKKVGIEINRNGLLDVSGLPTCPYERIQPASTSRALANCRSALVGEGHFSALVGLKGQEPYLTHGRMLIFNGAQGKKPVLFGQIYSTFPFATSFVITFAVKRLSGGTYGTALSATLPPSLRAWGNLTEIQMRLSRSFTAKGKRRSFLSAGCPAPKGFGAAAFSLARASFAFDGGPSLASTLADSCKVR